MLANEEIYKDSEQLVIAALLIEQTAFFRISNVLRSEMFFTNVHREIFACLEKMSEKGEAIDLLTVGNSLKNNDLVDQAGGMVLLAELSGRLYSTLHLEEHAHIVFSAFVSRQILLYATQLAQLAKLNELSGEHLLIEAHNKLDAIDQVIPCFGSVKNASEIIQQSKEDGFKRMEQYQKGISCTGIPTQLPDMDIVLGGWQKSDLIILAARPSIGKTALAMHFVTAACKSKKHVLIFSLEMSAVKLGDRLLIGKSNVDADRWRNGSGTIYDMEAIEHASGFLSELPFHIDDTSQISLGQIKASALRMQQRGQCELLVIDYLQLADMKAENKYQNRQDLVSQASRQAKIIAKELNIPVILLSQLNRESESRPGRKPELADLRDSGAIEQDADVVVLIHRPAHYGILEDRKGVSTVGRGELIVAKHRNGPTGTVYFKHNSSLTIIEPYILDKK